MEYLRHSELPDEESARWCTNEKAALEAALGVSMVGRRSLVVMKHVGLNVEHARRRKSRAKMARDSEVSGGGGS